MREAAPGVQVDLGELAAQAGAQQQEQNIVIREQTWKIGRIAIEAHRCTYTELSIFCRGKIKLNLDQAE